VLGVVPGVNSVSAQAPGSYQPTEPRRRSPGAILSPAELLALEAQQALAPGGDALRHGDRFSPPIPR